MEPASAAMSSSIVPDTTYNLAPYDSISFWLMNIQGVNTRAKLMLGDWKGSWVQSNEFTPPGGWTNLWVRKSGLTVGTGFGFSDAGKGTNFDWQNVTDVRLMFLQPSASSPPIGPEELCIDLLQANDAPVPAPAPAMLDNFQIGYDSTGWYPLPGGHRWNASDSGGATWDWFQPGGCAWMYTTGNSCMRDVITIPAGDASLGSCRVEQTDTAYRPDSVHIYKLHR